MNELGFWLFMAVVFICVSVLVALEILPVIVFILVVGVVIWWFN